MQQKLDLLQSISFDQIKADSASGIGASPATHQMSLNLDRSIY
ncbi:hypothetical protein pb186bvf_021041 [Paramecium bursaria]